MIINRFLRAPKWRGTLRRGRIKRTDAILRRPSAQAPRVSPSRKFGCHRFLSCLGCGLLLLGAGCDLKDFIHWAPDGQHAFVQGADGTWLIDNSGAIVGKATDARAWLPDSHHVIAIRAVKPKNWNEYAQLLGTNDIDRVTEAANFLAKAIQSYHGAWSNFDQSASYKSWEQTEIGDSYNGIWLLQSATFYLRQTNPQAIAPVLDAMSADDKAKIDDLTPDIHELVIRNALPPGLPADQLLLRFPFGISWVAASPSGQAIAFAAETPGRPSLYVIPRSANAAASLVDQGAAEADWSTDGQNLVYAKTTVPYEFLSKSVQLGTITTRQVCGTNSQLLADLPPAKDLAGVLLGGDVTRVACLPDGRILFAAASVHLPAITADMPSHLTLFALPAGATQSVAYVVSTEDLDRLPNRADRFVLSPDKKKVAIPGDAGQVSILSLDTEKLVSIQEAKLSNETQDHDQLLPSWRTANEIAIAVPAGSSTNQDDVALVNLNGGKTIISRTWSNGMTKSFLPNTGK